MNGNDNRDQRNGDGGSDDQPTGSDVPGQPEAPAPAFERVRTWQTGTDPPSPPSASVAEAVADVLDGRSDADVVGCLRLALRDPDTSTYETLVAELAEADPVVGTSIGHGWGPSAEDAFDVLLDMGREGVDVTSVLPSLDAITGVAFAEFARPDSAPTTGERGGREADGAEHGDAGESAEEAAPAEAGTDENASADTDPEEDTVRADGARTDEAKAAGPGDVEDGAEGGPETDATLGLSPRGRRDTSHDGDQVALDPDVVLDALVEALATRSVDAADLTAIREGLGVTTAESTRARLDHLHRQVDELLAYADDLEAFIEGTDGGRRVARIASAVSHVDGRLDELTDTTDDLASRLEDVDDRLEAVEASGGAAGSEEFEREVRSSLDELAARLDEVAAQVEAMQAWRDRLESAAERPPDAHGDER